MSDLAGEASKARYNSGEAANLYFWRDNNGVGADLVYEQDGKLQSIEIKSGATVTCDYIKVRTKDCEGAMTFFTIENHISQCYSD